MDEQELKLWHMVDVGHYGARISEFDCYFAILEINVDKGEGPPEKGRSIQQGIENLKERYDAIDISLLDDRFPIEAITRIQQEYFPQLIESYNNLAPLIENYNNGTLEDKAAFLEAIYETHGIIGKMKRTFPDSPRYREYRNLTAERDRWYTED